MPELAEVETLTRYLKKHVVNEGIKFFKQNRSNLRYPLNPKLKDMTENSSKIDVQRRAKFLNILMDNNNSLIFHLGMSGQLTVKPENYLLQKHDHIQIGFTSGKQLVFNDARRFGMVYGCESKDFHAQNFLKNMGIEPLTTAFNATYLEDTLANKKTAIKTAIMDSRIVVGVGNIYAAESLFLAKINPTRIASKLSQDELKELVKAIKLVLTKAIEAGGTTLKGFVSGDSKHGYFKQELSVYGRTNKACYVCNDLIKKIKQSGRSSFYCPGCQS